MSASVQKSFYVFLTSLLGSLLFLVLHRILVFAYLVLLYGNYETFSFGLSFIELLALDYFTLILALLAGAWYGVWVGIYWFEVVYEEGQGGFVGHAVRHYWPSRKTQYNLRSKLEAASEKLEADLSEVESLAARAKEIASAELKPKKRVVRRKSK